MQPSSFASDPYLKRGFSRKLRDTKAEEKSVAMLDCEGLRIGWLKGILKSGSKYKIKQQENILSLTIKDLEKSDNDIYTCDVGTVQSTAELKVQGKT
ncbi:hypothetical protein SKAU_G00060890 [Synaphobranchus kaupii]|uniref:Immunoglobulin domain-containing protein n=1 Tax=Synaphobranchus kaupii TaxID=118154 RepID=A0A9Q1J8K7_SYNKA|nr:hypothetical protein SKAU_G00060890 [Synaphobranchus kaupii]